MTKDPDLKKLFLEMNLQEPTSVQLTRWQRFMNAAIAQKSKRTITQMWWQWLIAGSIGFASAAIYFKSPNHQEVNEYYSETATSEYTYDK